MKVVGNGASRIGILELYGFSSGGQRCILRETLIWFSTVYRELKPRQIFFSSFGRFFFFLSYHNPLGPTGPIGSLFRIGVCRK